MTLTSRARLLALAIVVLALSGCGPADSSDETFARISQPVAAPTQAHCSIVVEGKGTKDLENDYLPHVVQCENGGANLEALKAQAIAARSVAYYNIATKGSICDGQGCQVYSCGATPSAKHIQAVKETAGMILSYGGTLTYGFFVAGSSNAAPPSCHGSGGSTEKYVTYNAGKTGTSVQQTSLGYIGPPGFGQNRGCMSQWGARCLENSKGYGYADILRFYYGADIAITKTTGSCTGSCEPKSCNGSKIVSDCGEGDCAAYGASCVNDSKGVRCVSVFCPAQGTKKVCVNEKLIGDCKDGAISTGDCSVYGAQCVDDELGARCVSVFCPAKGTTKSCLDDSKIIDCKDGGIAGTGDCGAFGAYCSKAGAQEARCVSVFCVDGPDQAPEAHDVCLPDGRLAHCTADGGLENAVDCPASDPCVQTASGAGCGGPGSSGGASGAAGESASGGSSAGSGGAVSTGGKGGSAATDGQSSRVVGGDDGGCTCSASGRSQSSAGWLFALLGLGVGLSQRRRLRSVR